MQLNPIKRQERDLQLLGRIEKGDRDAMEILLGHYKNLVRYKASTMYMAGADSEDVIQEGMIGLFKAIRDYRPEHGLMFSSFAGYCIMSQITDAVRQASRQKHKPLNESVSLQGAAGSDPESGLAWQDLIALQDHHDPEQRLLDLEKQQVLQSFIRHQLSEFERKVVLLYLQSLSYQQIADFLICSIKSVDNALSRVRRKMKQHQIHQKSQTQRG